MKLLNQGELCLKISYPRASCLSSMRERGLSLYFLVRASLKYRGCSIAQRNGPSEDERLYKNAFILHRTREGFERIYTAAASWFLLVLVLYSFVRNVYIRISDLFEALACKKCFYSS